MEPHNTAPPQRCTFDELLQQLPQIAEKEARLPSGALTKLLASKELCEKTKSLLESLNIHSFEYVGSGKDAFLASISDKQVVRISSKTDVSPLTISQVLQPVYSKEVRDHNNTSLRVEILPLLKQQEITPEHKEALCVEVSKRGFYFTDPKLYTDKPSEQNVMLLPDGTPIIIDREAASHSTDDPFVHMDREAFAAKPLTGYHWEGKQEHFFPEIVTGEIITYPPSQPGKEASSFRARLEEKQTQSKTPQR